MKKWNWLYPGMILIVLSWLPLISTAQTDVEAIEFDYRAYIERNLNIGNQTPEEITAQTEDFLAAEGYEEGMSFIACRMYAPEDKAFLIFQTEWEGCGAYCNTWYENLLAIPLGKGRYQLSESDINWERIDSILPMPEENEWLIFSSSNGRPRGVEGVSCQHARLVWLSKTLQENWQFEACTSSLVDREEVACELTYHPKKQEVRYVYDWYDEEDDFRPYRVSGKWRYDSGAFKQLKEKLVDLPRTD